MSSLQPGETPSTGRAALLGIAFLAELCMLFGLAWVGWSMGPNTAVSIALLVLLPLGAAVVWGVWCAPRSGRRLRTPARWALKVTLFSATVWLLMAYGPAPSAAMFGLGMWLLFIISLPADRTPVGQ